MKYLPDFSSRFRILKGGKISLVVSALIGSVTLLSAAPSGGTVTSGSATISQSGATTNITQSTNKATINWQNFSIASNETVNFAQPNVNSITLNRVIGNEKSIINGALNANGQVWLLNSSGVLFGKDASINTAGILATTKTLSDADFNAGNYNFKGESTASVINMGTIEVSDSGYVALLANTVSNEGTIKAIKGTVHLTGANEATINLNGNSLVNLTVNKGVLDALVQNKGAVIADGGKIFLTTNAVDELLKGVVNNSGVLEANSLDDVTGHVELFAHGGTANVSGTIEAIGGFVETSGKNLSIADGTIVKAKTWLLDPDYVIIGDRIPNQYYEDGLVETTISANTIVTSLNAGTDVLIESDDDIEVNENIITGAMANDATLKLKAGGDIVVYDNVTIDATQNSNTNKLNVWMSVANVTNSSFYMKNGSSVKTNGGSFTVGGEIANNLPSIDGTASVAYGVSISDGVTIDAGVGNITLTAAGTGGAVSVDRATLTGANIDLKAYGENEIELQGSNIEATQNLAILGANVYMEGRDIEDVDANVIGYAYTKLTADEISITSNALAENYPDTMEIYDTVINTNDKLTINASANIDLDGSQINFENTGGTLEINAYTSMTKQERIDAQILYWDAGDEATLLEWINDDDGTSYASMDEYFAENAIYLPMLVELKGGTYKSTLFSDGTPSELDTSTLAIFNNGFVAFGNGLQNSVNEFGMLNQPLYYDTTDAMWYRLTYSNYPLAAIIGVGGDGTDDWNLNGSFVTTITDSESIPYIDGAFSTAVLNTTGLSNGSGTIVATNTVTIDGKTLEMTNTYTLGSDKSAVAIETKLKNTSESAMENLRLWIGAQDDYVAGSDETTKARGNLVDGEFVQITETTEIAKALMITGGTAGILFQATSEKSNVFGNEEYGDNFYTLNPAESLVLIEESDGAYGLFTRLSDLAVGASESVGVYYGAGSLASLADLAESVSDLANGSSEEPVIEEPVVVTPPVVVVPPVVEKQIAQVVDAIINTSALTVQLPTEFVTQSSGSFGSLFAPVVTVPNATTNAMTNFTNSPLLSGLAQSLGVNAGEGISLVSMTIEGTPTQLVSLVELQTALSEGNANDNATPATTEVRVALSSDSIIELINGGVNLPADVDQEFYVVKTDSKKSKKGK